MEYNLLNLFINIVNCFVRFFLALMIVTINDCYNTVIVWSLYVITVICMIIKRNDVFIFAYKFLNKEKLNENIHV